MCSCSTDTEKQKMYWLLFALWQSKEIEYQLIGSVIPFIRIRDLEKIIKQKAQEHILSAIQEHIPVLFDFQKKRAGVFEKIQANKPIKNIFSVQSDKIKNENARAIGRFLYLVYGLFRKCTTDTSLKMKHDAKSFCIFFRHIAYFNIYLSEIYPTGQFRTCFKSWFVRD